MGIDTNGAFFLLHASRQGVMFERTALLGRQELWLEAPELQQVLARCRLQVDQGLLRQILAEDPSQGKVFAEAFLQFCGAREIKTIDYSNYQGATLVQDLNQPIPSDLHNQFSVVLDGGTLEHVFHLPQALWNCMKMVRPGGHFLAITPCNNFLGHGFYQLSPELFFSLFVPKHGFQVEEMLIFEDVPMAPMYQVTRPTELTGRVQVRNSLPTFLLVRARKVSELPLDRPIPQQSDFEAAWQGKKLAPPVSGFRSWFRRTLPALWNFWKDLTGLFRPTFPEPFFKRRPDLGV